MTKIAHKKQIDKVVNNIGDLAEEVSPFISEVGERLTIETPRTQVVIILKGDE